jgi:hypothetical protein
MVTKTCRNGGCFGWWCVSVTGGDVLVGGVSV